MFTWGERKKRRDGASFGRVLEALSGHSFLIGAFIVHQRFFLCVFGAPIHPVTGWHVNVLAKCY
jgi:hypothetical protein